MNNFFVITNELKDNELKYTNYIYAYLKAHGKNCDLDIMQTEKCFEDSSCFNSKMVPEHTECILVLGGDGTLLRAARNTAHLGIPLIGVNLGNLGYMAEVEISNLEAALEALISDHCEIEERMMISGTVYHNQEEVSVSQALNDITLTRTGSLHVISFAIYVNGQFLNAYEADGILVSTPTGSTGYNMSAGGPIVEPKASLMVVTPICPHTIHSRSIILAPEDKIEIRLLEGRNIESQVVALHFDGSENLLLETGDRIVITRSEMKTKMIRLNQVSFLEVLHKKMSEK